MKPNNCKCRVANRCNRSNKNNRNLKPIGYLDCYQHCVANECYKTNPNTCRQTCRQRCS